MKKIIGVIGGNSTTNEVYDQAYEVGRLIARNDAVLVCGGLGGVMEAASKGASEAGGVVLGILPSNDKSSANQWVTIAVPSNMGSARNALIVSTADVLIAFPGSYGTLNEMAMALNLGKTVIQMPGAWELQRAGKVESALFKQAGNPDHALGLALNAFTR
jgi:uncharacterized protein (TIGR00725 family)